MHNFILLVQAVLLSISVTDLFGQRIKKTEIKGVDVQISYIIKTDTSFAIGNDSMFYILNSSFEITKSVSLSRYNIHLIGDYKVSYTYNSFLLYWSLSDSTFYRYDFKNDVVHKGYIKNISDWYCKIDTTFNYFFDKSFLNTDWAFNEKNDLCTPTYNLFLDDKKHLYSLNSIVLSRFDPNEIFGPVEVFLTNFSPYVDILHVKSNGVYYYDPIIDEVQFLNLKSRKRKCIYKLHVKDAFTSNTVANSIKPACRNGNSILVLNQFEDTFEIIEIRL
ncbi:hypothetical protein [Chryseosolibacter indicus]|uniref:Uncharacterized protein n=1 Tax=Chryseosolibacter indicus TaxID=2782351 RepID=A0ABS5VW61_9BACT|nr:hypothetical protein [Chryseosolibacter indicus]MBT1704236.1 hypothetical protein [Chryseosolibacter indicus]